MTGAELVKKLKESFTPEHYLAIGRDALNRNRAASAAEVIAAYADVLGDDHGTTEKARVIAETGTHLPRDAKPEDAIEEQILNPKGNTKSPEMTKAK